MITRPVRLLLIAAAVVLFAGSAFAQGIRLKDRSVVLAGSPSNCTAPATVRFEKLAKATQEWRTIRSEGISKGSARYTLLMAQMEKRIKGACAAVAQREGNDCVVRRGDIRSDNGLSVRDLTDVLVQRLESGGL